VKLMSATARTVLIQFHPLCVVSPVLRGCVCSLFAFGARKIDDNPGFCLLFCHLFSKDC
jgi:hypothetical protein